MKRKTRSNEVPETESGNTVHNQGRRKEGRRCENTKTVEVCFGLISLGTSIDGREENALASSGSIVTRLTQPSSSIQDVPR